MAAKTTRRISIQPVLNKKVPKWHRLASPITFEVRPVSVWVEPAIIIESDENPAEVAAQAEEARMHKRFQAKANKLSRFQKDIKYRVKLLEKLKDEQRRQEYEKAIQLEMQAFDKGAILEVFLPTDKKDVDSTTNQPLTNDGLTANVEALPQSSGDADKIKTAQSDSENSVVSKSSDISILQMVQPSILADTFRSDSGPKTPPQREVLHSPEKLHPGFEFKGRQTGQYIPSSRHLLRNVYKATDLRPGATAISQRRSQAQQMNLLRKLYTNSERILARENHRKEHCKRRNQMLKEKEHLLHTEEEQRRLVEEAEKEFTKFITETHLKREQQIQEEREQQMPRVIKEQIEKGSKEQQLQEYREEILNYGELREKQRIQKLKDSDLWLVEEQQRLMIEQLEQEFTDFIEDSVKKRDKQILKEREENQLKIEEQYIERMKDQQIQNEAERQQIEREERWKQRFSSTLNSLKNEPPVEEFLSPSPLCSCSYFLGPGTGCAHNCVYYKSSKEEDIGSHQSISRTVQNVSTTPQVVSQPPRIRKIYRRPL